MRVVQATVGEELEGGLPVVAQPRPRVVVVLQRRLALARGGEQPGLVDDESLALLFFACW
jgi:hypothetical protein